MFGLDPLSRPVAIAEILLLLAFVAFIGWLLGRLMLAGRITTLRLAIDDKKAELDRCRNEKAAGFVGVKTTEPVAFQPAYPYEAPEPEVAMEVPQLFVSADPLLPAYSHEDTPAPIVNDELAADIMDASATDAEETPATVTYPREEPEPETSLEAPHLFVSADPLLSIYSYDDTPSPLVDDELAAEINDASAPVLVEKLSLVGSAFEFPTEDESDEVAPTPVVEDRETIVLNRIKSRISEVNFDRIGRATAAQADDLKDIVGVGPYLERKLHTLGIYTFRQIANFTKEDIEMINEIIEFFPGRIEGDNWVGQSKAFYERKYGAKS